MIRRLRLKFIAINMGIVFLMLCVIMGLVFYFTRSNLERESIDMMQRIADRPFQLGSPGDAPEEVQLPYFMLQLGPQGELITTNSGYYDLSDGRFLQELVTAAGRSPQAFGVIEEYNLRYYRSDTIFGRILVFADISSERATLNSLGRNCFLIAALSFFLFLGASVLLSKWAVGPVESAWRQQHQFVADASHELKTPLTVILTDAELACSGEYGDAERQKFMNGILIMSRQMKNLVEQLLRLARSDSASAPGKNEAVDLSDCAGRAVLPFEPVFFEKGMELHTDIAENITVRGDGELLGQVVEILLDNAAKYGSPGGSTWVRLRKEGRGHCLLEVSDEGEAIPQEDLKRLFQRFWRADRARSRTGSFGLGLSIAESIITAHKGKIWAESRDGVNSFYVLLPGL